MFNDPELDAIYARSILDARNYQYNSNTPSKLFKLTNYDPIVRGYLKAWESGCLLWDDCLEKMHESLKDDCIRLNTEFGLGLTCLEESFTVKQFLDVHNNYLSCKPFIAIEKQNNLIEAILFAAELSKRMHEAVAIKLQNAPPPTIIKHADGRIEVKQHDLSNSEIPTQTEECIKPPKLDIG
jgi:hypothetical protein